MKKKSTSSSFQSPDQVMSLAWQAFSEGRLVEAGKHCADLVKSQPAHAHAWHLRGLVALAQGKAKQALDYLKKVVNAPDLLPSVNQATGRAQLALGQYEDAIVSFQQALSFQADDAFTHHLLALALLAQGETVSARQYFRRATLLSPELGPAHYELGVLALGSGDIKQAVSSFTLAAQHLPHAPQVANNLALAHQAAGDVLLSEQWFRRALDIDAKYAEAWFNLAGLLRAKGDKAAAEEAYSQALDLNPALKDAHTPDHRS